MKTDAAAKALLARSVLRFVAPPPPKTVAGPRQLWYARAADIFLAWQESTAQIITGYYAAYGAAGDDWLSHINSLGLKVIRSRDGSGAEGVTASASAAASTCAARACTSKETVRKDGAEKGLHSLRFHLSKDKLVAFALSDQSRLLHAWNPAPYAATAEAMESSVRGEPRLGQTIMPGKGVADVAKMFGQHWGIWREVTATLYASDLGTFARRVRDFQKQIFMVCQLFEIYFGPSQVCLESSGAAGPVLLTAEHLEAMMNEEGQEQTIATLRAASLPPLRVLHDRTDKTLRACAVQRRTLVDLAAERPAFSADEIMGQTAEQIADKRRGSTSSPSSSPSTTTSLDPSIAARSTLSAKGRSGAMLTKTTAATKAERYKTKLEEWKAQKLAKYDSSTKFREARRVKGYGTRSEYDAFLTQSIETKLKSIA